MALGFVAKLGSATNRIFRRLERVGLNKLDKSRWPNLEARYVQLTNLVAIIGTGVSYFQAIAELLDGKMLYAISDFVFGTLMLATLWLNRRGQLSFSRCFILLVLNLDIYYFNLVGNFDSDLELFYFAIVLIPFFLYSSKEKVRLVLMTGISFLLFYLSRFYPHFNILPEALRLPSPDWYARAVPIVTFPVTFILVYRFLKMNEDMHAGIVHASKFSALGEMAAALSHEINNPLTAITFNIHILKEELQKQPEVSQMVKDRIEAIERSQKNAAEVIHGLKVFSRQSDADPHIEVDLNRCIDDTLDLCRQRFDLHGIRMTVGTESNLYVFGNGNQISQVLVNLLNNAYDAIEEVPLKWVRVEARRIGDSIEIRIIDGGRGVSKEIVNKLMEPFVSTKPIGRGTGLGLSISKGIVESHRGELYLDRRAKNTSFVLRLPASAKNER